jgi:hypothetical protein
MHAALPLALVDQPQAVPTGEQVAEPVNLRNAPATNLTVGNDKAFEPRPAAAEAAFCPNDRDLLLDNLRFWGVGRVNAVDQHDGYDLCRARLRNDRARVPVLDRGNLHLWRRIQPGDPQGAGEPEGEGGGVRRDAET